MNAALQLVDVRGRKYPTADERARFVAAAVLGHADIATTTYTTAAGVEARRFLAKMRPGRA